MNEHEHEQERKNENDTDSGTDKDRDMNRDRHLQGHGGSCVVVILKSISEANFISVSPIKHCYYSNYLFKF
jgi:hypothetical protein